MKILQINITYKQNSTGKIAQAIQECLLENGEESCVAYCIKTQQDRNSFRFENDFEYFIRRAGNKIFGSQPRHAFLSTRRLIRFIRKSTPDLIHIHVVHHSTVNILPLMKYLIQIQIPVLITMHDCWMFTGGCYYFSKLGCRQYKTMCEECPKKRAEIDVDKKRIPYYFKKKKEIYMSLKSVHFVAVSNWLKRAAAESRLLRQYDISMIYNGVDVSVFKPARENRFARLDKLKGKKILIGVAVAWGGGRKGLNDFYALASCLDDSYHIVLVGNMAEKAENTNITFWGSVTDMEELSLLYSSALIFLNLSDEETFGMTTAEALACGTPVIAYDATAVGEIVEEGCGFKVKPHDIEGVVRNVYRIAQDGKGKYTEKCRETAKAYYSDGIMAKNYINLYREILRSEERKKGKGD